MRWPRGDERAAILATLGVTEVEYDAMLCPAYNTPMGLEEMARWTVVELDGSAQIGLRERTAEEYRVALQGMLEKGWLFCETKETLRQLDLLRQSGIPLSERRPLPPGSLTFTREGYLLHRRILLALHGRRFVQRRDSFYNVSPARRVVDFYAGSERACRQWAHLVQQASCVANLSTLVNGPAEVLAIEGPRPVGPWRPSRHLLLRRGWHVRVRYRKLRPLRLDLPELGVRAMADRLRPVFIDGTMGRLVLWLSDHPYWQLPVRRKDDSTASWRWSFQLSRFRKAERREGRWMPAPPVFELEEPPGNRRRAPLTLREARRILRECVEAYRASSR